mgnify:CR=1 FL=1
MEGELGAGWALVVGFGGVRVIEEVDAGGGVDAGGAADGGVAHGQRGAVAVERDGDEAVEELAVVDGRERGRAGRAGRAGEVLGRRLGVLLRRRDLERSGHAYEGVGAGPGLLPAALEGIARAAVAGACGAAELERLAGLRDGVAVLGVVALLPGVHPDDEAEAVGRQGADLLAQVDVAQGEATADSAGAPLGVAGLQLRLVAALLLGRDVLGACRRLLLLLLLLLRCGRLRRDLELGHECEDVRAGQVHLAALALAQCACGAAELGRLAGLQDGVAVPGVVALLPVVQPLHEVEDVGLQAADLLAQVDPALGDAMGESAVAPLGVAGLQLRLAAALGLG